MDTTKAWTKLFDVYTDGINVWAMRGTELLGVRCIGQDVDGPDVALQDAVRDLARDAVDQQMCGAAYGAS